jgi:hypothetical protein
VSSTLAMSWIGAVIGDSGEDLSLPHIIGTPNPAEDSIGGLDRYRYKRSKSKGDAF